MSKKMPHTKQICLHLGGGRSKFIVNLPISKSSYSLQYCRRRARCVKRQDLDSKAKIPEVCSAAKRPWNGPGMSSALLCSTVPCQKFGLVSGMQSSWLHDQICRNDTNDKVVHQRDTKINFVRSKELASLTCKCLTSLYRTRSDSHVNCIPRTDHNDAITNPESHLMSASLRLRLYCQAKHIQKSKPSNQAFLPHGLPHPIRIPSRSIHTSSHPDLVEMTSVDDFSGPTLTQMTTYLTKQKVGCTLGYTCLIVQCPFCKAKKTSSTVTTKSTGVDSERKNAHINMVTGWTSCQCGKANGSWENFQESIAILKKQKKSSSKSATQPLLALPLCDDNLQDGDSVCKDTEKANALWEKAEELARCDDDYLTGLREKFPLQKITKETLERFQVRVDKSKGTLLLPVRGGYDQSDQLLGVIRLDIAKDKNHHKKVVETYCSRDGLLGLFGYNHLKPGASEVILTESVLDALAVYQDTGKEVLSLPHGSAMLPQQVLPLLEQFKKVTLWFSNDMRSWEACKQFAKKLNSKRCHLIRPLEAHTAPLVTLNHGKSLKSIVKKAVPVTHKAITSFRALRQEVLGELCHAEQVAGVKWKRFEQLNKLLKGHRRGELTVFTGPTGSGKTTFMAEYSLDLCMQGVNTLWGSFEIQNVRLAKVMLTQFSGVNLSKHLDKFDESADKFEMLPLHFMAFHGQQSLQKVLEAMSHAAYVHDIQHVIVDNLQFMVGYSEKQTVIDRFSVYDTFIAAFRKFATFNNCHVTLVIHPRKERETEELHTSSIFGSAKASQESDNVLILQDQTFIKPKSRKYIQVAKNRFDGECGRMPLSFNKDTLTMSYTPQKRKKKPKADGKTGESEEKSSLDSSFEDYFEEYNIGDEELGYQE